MNNIVGLIRNEDGAVVEQAVLTGLIVLVIIAVVALFKDKILLFLDGIFGEGGNLEDAADGLDEYNGGGSGVGQDQ